VKELRKSQVGDWAMAMMEGRVFSKREGEDRENNLYTG
jgi:hypothetical protein